LRQSSVPESGTVAVSDARGWIRQFSNEQPAFIQGESRTTAPDEIGVHVQRQMISDVEEELNEKGITDADQRAMAIVSHCRPWGTIRAATLAALEACYRSVERMDPWMELAFDADRFASSSQGQP
jgi:hypothetical protein